MAVGSDNTVHMLWDSSGSPQQTTVVFYTKFIAGDAGNRVDHILPSTDESLLVGDANFFVSEDTVQYVCMAAPFLTYDFSIFYSRSTNAGNTFSDLVPVDTVDADYPVIAKSNYGPSFVLFSNGDQLTYSLIYGRQVIDSTLTFAPQFRIGPSWMVTQPEPIFVGNQFGNFLTYEAIDTIAIKTAFYEYDNLQAGPIDSGSFPLFRDPHLAVDSLGGKYLVASHQTDFRVYVTRKDVVVDVSPIIHKEEGFGLEQNYPNPFNPITRIVYAIRGRQSIVIEVYSLLGQKVATLEDGIREAGSHSVYWNAAGNPSGVYFYRLKAGGLVETRKLVLVR